MKKLAFILIFAIFLVACASTAGKVVGNALVLSEINRLSELQAGRNLTAGDFSSLRDMVKGDPVASDEFGEIDWLLSHNETEHATHALAFLNGYVQTGTISKCIAHEMQHIRLYIQHNDFAMVEKGLKDLDVDSWVKRTEQLKVKFPAYYTNFDQVKADVTAVISNLNVKDFSNETIQKLQYIEKNAVC